MTDPALALDDFVRAPTPPALSGAGPLVVVHVPSSVDPGCLNGVQLSLSGATPLAGGLVAHASAAAPRTWAATGGGRRRRVDVEIRVSRGARGPAIEAPVKRRRVDREPESRAEERAVMAAADKAARDDKAGETKEKLVVGDTPTRAAVGGEVARKSKSRNGKKKRSSKSKR